jgi:hypothetical protein
MPQQAIESALKVAPNCVARRLAGTHRLETSPPANRIEIIIFSTPDCFRVFSFDEPSLNHLAKAMAGGDNAQEAVGSPAPVDRGFASLNTLK